MHRHLNEISSWNWGVEDPWRRQLTTHCYLCMSVYVCVKETLVQVMTCVHY